MKYFYPEKLNQKPAYWLTPPSHSLKSVPVHNHTTVYIICYIFLSCSTGNVKVGLQLKELI